MGWVRICYKLSFQQILQNNDESIFENNTSRAKFNTLPALDRCCFQILTHYYFIGFAANQIFAYIKNKKDYSFNEIEYVVCH